MSDSIKKLVEVVKKDEGMAKKFQACKSAEEQSKLASELGFSISAAEFKEFSKSIPDDQLDNVAGGGCFLNLIG